MVVIAAAGDLPGTPTERAVLASATLLIAADAGAERLAALGYTPHRIVGDVDSLSPERLESLRRHGAVIERYPSDKDQTDLELAVRSVMARGATRVVILGALGGPRPDHALANVALLLHPDFASLDLAIVAGSARCFALRGERTLPAATGAIVTLLALAGPAHGVTTHGLRWPLREATLLPGSSWGVSNEVVAPPAWVRVDDGVLLAWVVDRGAEQG